MSDLDAAFHELRSELLAVREKHESNLSRTLSQIGVAPPSDSSSAKERHGSSDNIKSIVSENETMKREIISLQSEFLTAREELESQLEAKTSEAASMKDEMDRKISSLTSENDLMMSEIESLRNENLASKEGRQFQMDCSESPDVGAVIQEYNEKLSTLTAENSEMKLAMETLSNEFETALNDIKDLQYDQRTLRAENQKLKNEVQTLEEEVIDADTAIEEAKGALERLMEEKEEAEDTVERLEEDKATLDAALESTKREMTSMREEQSENYAVGNDRSADEIQRLQDELDTAVAERDEAKSAIDKISADKRYALEEVRQLQKEKEASDKLVKEAKDSIAKANTEKRYALEEVMQLKEERKGSESAVEEVKKELEEIHKQHLADIESLTAENNELNAKLKEKANGESGVAKQLQRLEEEKAQAFAEIEEMEKDMESSKKECEERIDTLMSSMASSRNEYTAEIAALKEENNRIKRTVGTLLAEKKSAEEQIQSLSREKKETDLAMDGLKRELSTIKRKYETEIISLSSSLSSTKSRESNQSNDDVLPKRNSFTEEKKEDPIETGRHSGLERSMPSNFSSNDGPPAVPSHRFEPEKTRASFYLEEMRRNIYAREGKRSSPEPQHEPDSMSITSDITGCTEEFMLPKFEGDRGGRDALKAYSARARNSVQPAHPATREDPSEEVKITNLSMAARFLERHSDVRAEESALVLYDEDGGNEGRATRRRPCQFTSGVERRHKSASIKPKDGYDGEYNSTGQKHGRGTLKCENGNEYCGDWKFDKREGHGTARYNTGDVYVGQWKNCKRHGHGTMFISNGDVFEGGWKESLKHGAGTYKWTDGEVDISWYRDDKRTGEGVRWTVDRRKAYRLVRGTVKEEISLAEAAGIAESLHLPVPK